MAAAKVYTEQLYQRDYGRASYVPQDETNIGDVGFFQKVDGRFRRLFNCLVPANHPLNIDGVPSKYEPYALSLNHLQFDDEFLPPQPIVSKSVVIVDVSVNLSG